MKFFKTLKSVKIEILILIIWLLTGYIGRSMMKYYWRESFRDSLGEYSWTTSDERQYNNLIPTGPVCCLYNIFYIATHKPRWGLVLDFKATKIPTWEEHQRSKKQK